MADLGADEGSAPDAPWRHEEAVVNGVRLHYVEAGEPADPTVLLLHGFPECWYAWRHQLPALADAGFHVVAPDMRGYNRSEKPPGIRSYRLDELVGDVVGLVEHVGKSPARAVVGHDWGGVVAWELGSRRPDAVEKLAVCNAPHLAAYRRGIRSASQLRKSWYVGFFQLPWLPEFLLGLGDCEAVARLLRDGPAVDGAFDDEAVRRYRGAFCRSGARRAAINYYRALFRETAGEMGREAFGLPVDSATGGRVEVPTLLLWGERDAALDVRLTEGLDRWVPDLRVERLPDASHWVQNEAPERVNELLVEFLAVEAE